MSVRRMMGHWLIAGGRPKQIRAEGKVLFVSSGLLGVGEKAQETVKFWCEERADEPYRRTFATFRTGEPLPEEAVWHGSVETAAGRVWHLFELFGEET